MSCTELPPTFSLKVKSNFTDRNIKVKNKTPNVSTCFYLCKCQVWHSCSCILRLIRTSQFFLEVAFNRALLCSISQHLKQTATRKTVPVGIERASRNNFHCECGLYKKAHPSIMTLFFWSYAINKLNLHVKQRLNFLFCKQMKFPTFFA